MAVTFTKLYLTTLTAEYAPDTLRGAWDDTAAVVTCALSASKVGGGTLRSVARNEVSNSPTYDVLLYRGVSGPLAAQTISGDLDVVLGVTQNNYWGDADFCFHVHAYVTQGDSDTPRGTLLSDYVETTANGGEWPTETAAGQPFTAAQAMSAVVASAGDRLVVEIGYIARNSVTSNYTGTLWYGTQRTTDLAPADDLTAAADGTTRAGFVSFSSAITEVDTTVRETQVGVETILGGTGTARLSQLAVETVQASASPNTPPVVDAGADQSVANGGTATLTGSASDDGLPDPPAALTYQWTQVSGPGTAAFDPDDALTTDITFDTPGVYVLRLTVSDSDLSASDDVTVTALGAETRVTQYLTETIEQRTATDLAITQFLVEAVERQRAPVSLTQYLVEVVEPTPTPTAITQYLIEVVEPAPLYQWDELYPGEDPCVQFQFEAWLELDLSAGSP